MRYYPQVFSYIQQRYYLLVVKHQANSVSELASFGQRHLFDESSNLVIVEAEGVEVSSSMLRAFVLTYCASKPMTVYRAVQRFQKLPSQSNLCCDTLSTFKLPPHWSDYSEFREEFVQRRNEHGMDSARLIVFSNDLDDSWIVSCLEEEPLRNANVLALKKVNLE